MKSPLRRPLISVFGLALVACGGELRESEETSLVGDWDWAAAIGGHLEGFNTTLGRGQQLRFGEREFSIFDGDSVVGRGTFLVQGTDVAARSKERGPLLVLSDSPPLLLDTDWVVHLSGDTLTLMTVVDDDFDHVFVRGRR
jgi:hypothetical protein